MRYENEEKKVRIVLFVLFILCLCFLLMSCTISFQNISTNGRASDLVDENQTASPSTDFNLSKIPF
jgi:hypothetical protein